MLNWNVGNEEVVKVGVDNFINQFEFIQDYENLQSFFVNFGDRQVLLELKELHLSLDLSSIEADYPALVESEEKEAQSFKLIERRIRSLYFLLLKIIVIFHFE
ncbi:hypothetical protein Fot_35069 [Forsythia ovata]|uniref:Uncharacterized protein n=1 Tax=Forsythia ovata TaxID=205694 RepID=A0ABD1SKI6_9LAMI